MIIARIVIGAIVADPGRALAALVIARIVIGAIVADPGRALAALVIARVVVGRVIAHALGTLATLVIGDGQSTDDGNRLRFGRDLVGSGDGEAAEQGEGDGDSDAGEDSSTHWGDLLGFGGVIVRPHQG